MTKEQILQKLFSLHQFGIKLGLDKTFSLLNEINNPHQKLKCFHVAGSNGKGSTSSFLASILMELGFNVGLYTSPHFVRFNERIKINGREIDDNFIIEFVKMLNDYIEKEKPTFFEITTAMAFKYFEINNVDYAVIETGLGGRLDSTNVVNPIASIITSISLEHIEHLGNSLEKIAFEKAGIIKKGKPVFLGKLSHDAEKVIIKKANEENSNVYKMNDYLIEMENYVIVSCKNFNLKIYQTPLIGYHQFYNSALAIKTIDECLNIEKSQEVINGINNVIKNTGIQGRYEIFNENPRIIFDSAHNPEGVICFTNEFEKEYLQYKSRKLIFSVMKDKDIETMLSQLKKYFDEFFYYQLNMDRATDYDIILKVANKLKVDIKKITSPIEYLNNFYKKNKNECLVILGSMYLLGEIKSEIILKGT